MVQRHFWLELVEQAWRSRSVLWLSGVRRVGKTCLCQTLPKAEYFDCELPRVRRSLLDPESFLDGLRGLSPYCPPVMLSTSRRKASLASEMGGK